MKIILICGLSGSGKTSIAKGVIKKFGDKFNFINSYTDRAKRSSKEWGHEFVSPSIMDALLSDADIVASTKINEYRYCSTKNQFDENKINLYIVDTYGINDTIEAFPYAEIMVVLVDRESINVDCIREGRDINVPLQQDVDFIINNNGTLESSIEMLNALTNFDLFKKPSHKPKTTKDIIEHIDAQARFLNNIRESLLSQFWYENESVYIKMCQYVEEHVCQEYMEIEIKPDTKPDIYDGSVNFNVIGVYDDDIPWQEMNKLHERMSYYAHEFLKDYEDLSWYVCISTQWRGEEEYV